MAKSSWHTKWTRAPRQERTDRAGNLFQSKAELARWEKLLLWQVAGEIRNLKRQVKYELRLPDGTPVLTPAGKVAFYTADFVYERAILIHGGNDTPASTVWSEVIEEYKGYRNDGSALRIGIFEAIYKKKVHIVRK